MSEDYGTIEKQLARIADALEQLVINKKAQMINEALQKEDKQFTKETLEVDEEVLMDLKEVTVVDETPKSFVVFKDGYQKLVPFSLIKAPPKDQIEFQSKYNLVLTENGEKWFHTKSWKPYTPYKKGGG